MATDNKTISQAGVVPYRICKGQPKFCLITSIRKGRWQFPKGLIDPGETALETAQKESLEEAGLHGVIDSEPLGSYEYRKWDSDLQVTVFLMRVTRADDEWDEDEYRHRRWCHEENARKLLGRDDLLGLLDAAVQRIARPG